MWLLGTTPAGRAAAEGDADPLPGRPVDLSAWAHAYSSDLDVQDKPEAYFVLRRLDRLDRAYRPVSRMALPDNLKKPPLLPPPVGALASALLWEGRVELHRLELVWPPDAPVPPPEGVEVRLYPSPYGWFGWQWDHRVAGRPRISPDGRTWVYPDLASEKPAPPPGPYGLCLGRGKESEVDMVAVFVRAGSGREGPTKGAVPRIRAYGPDVWKSMDLEIEWGFREGTETRDFGGSVEGFYGIVTGAAPLPGDAGTAMAGPRSWDSRPAGGGRRGVALSILYDQPEEEVVDGLPRFPYGHPRDGRITVWTRAGSFTFLPKDLAAGPILAPEHGFFVARAGGGVGAREFVKRWAARRPKSIREMTREHREATWDEAMREIKLPLLPAGTALPPYRQVPDPPMRVEVPEKRWTDAWRMGAEKLRAGELSYMSLALEAPRPIRDMDLVGLHDKAAEWLETFLRRPGTTADGDFADGEGNFCAGNLFHGTALCPPGHDTYELIHNGGTGRILYDLAEHYFLTGDKEWFRRHRTRMGAAAEWIIRQRKLYLSEAPNRDRLAVAGLQPPQHISDIATYLSEWKWYAVIDAWYCQGLRRFAEAVVDVDHDREAMWYLEEAEGYRRALAAAVDRAIALAPVLRVRDGSYRSCIPPVFYARGPSIGQVNQIAMTDDDWPLGAVDAADIPARDDPRLDGHLDVCEDVLAFRPTYLYSGTRFRFLAEKRRAAGRPADEDWFWGGESPQLGYSFLADVYLRRDEVASFLRQWTNNYAAFVMPTPEYAFLEHFMGHTNAAQMESFRKGDHRGYANGHALAYFVETFRSLLVWEDGRDLWLAKATPRRWLEAGREISVRDAPTYFGAVSYALVSDADHGKIAATVALPARRPVRAVLLRLRHPAAAPMKGVEVDGRKWTNFDPARETVRLEGRTGTVKVVATY